MHNKAVSTRRLFFWQAGAALSAPLAAASASASTELGGDNETLKARLEMLEDLNAIQALQQAYAKHLNAGAHEQIGELFVDASSVEIETGIRGLIADAFKADDFIELGGDRMSATSVTHCTVEIETEIGPSCTLVEMARLQGEGSLKHLQRRMLENTYIKQGGVWKIERTKFRLAEI